MNTVKVALQNNSYEVVIGRNLLSSTGELIKEIIKPCMVCVVSDDTVYGLYGEEVISSLERAGYGTCRFIFKHGESSKNINTFNSLLEFFAESSLTRSDLVIALGGGVTGDLAGFAAACYLRGVGFIQIPTTLLAAIDSSVGGKTGVNLKAGKNLAGAFLQPKLVICDCDTLRTLSREILSDGIAEAIKYGMIYDKELFDILEKSNFLKDSEACIARCVEIKSRVVVKDEYDKGERQLLNFGHTIGHSIEKSSDYKISHGHSVSIGMCVMTKAAQEHGLCKKGTLERLTTLLEKYKLPVKCDYDASTLAKTALADKKRSGDKIILVIATEVGKSILYPISVSGLEKFISTGL